MNIELDSPLPCTYEITSHDYRGVFQGTVMKGNNLAGPIDSFSIPTDTSELDQRVIGWQFVFGNPPTATGKNGTHQTSTKVFISFLQGENELMRAPVALDENHQSEKVFIGFARFVNSDT